MTQKKWSDILVNCMNRISWCKQRQRGITRVEPNINLSQQYIINASDSIRVLRAVLPTKSRMWIATLKYYIKYFGVYAILIRLGVKSEIHECTIAVAELLEEEGLLPNGMSKDLKEDKDLRADNQYYLKDRIVDIDFDKLALFIASINQSLYALNDQKISEIRAKIQNA